MLDDLNRQLADRYAIERELGRGGMATVWLARDLRLGRSVAIKVLNPELAGAIGVDRFLREIQLTAGLQHPNIIPVLDSGTVPGPAGVHLPWYSMAHVAGESLRSRLQRDGVLPVDDAVSITEHVASALKVAHAAGIVHRDIKPENLLLSGGQVLVADFGIAKALLDTGGEHLTSTGLAIGTPAYMSPEQASAASVGPRSDQYSLASVLYEMLTGEPPFTGPTAQAIIARRMTEVPRPIHAVRPSVPRALEAAVLRALDPVPADRFADIAAFASALRGSEGAAAPVAGERTRGSRRRLLASGMLAAIAVTAWLGWTRRGTASAPRDPEVVALYQRGKQAHAKRTRAGSREAIELFNAAIVRDSTWAEAWAALATAQVRAYSWSFGFGGSRDSAIRLAAMAADRALLLDSLSAEAWLAKGQVAWALDPTSARAMITSARRALARDSSSGPAWQMLAMSLENAGDHPGALAAQREVVRHAPQYEEGVAFLGMAHYWRRQLDSAAHWADSAIATDPAFFLARTTAGQVAVERGDLARARAEFAAATRIGDGPGVSTSLAGSALVEARAGNRARGLALMRQAESLAVGIEPTPQHTAVYFAHALAALGDTARALWWLERYSPPDDLHFQLHLLCDPPLDGLAATPRFQALLIRPRPPGGACQAAAPGSR